MVINVKFIEDLLFVRSCYRYSKTFFSNKDLCSEQGEVNMYINGGVLLREDVLP